jgi:hypothetical protein
MLWQLSERTYGNWNKLRSVLIKWIAMLRAEGIVLTEYGARERLNFSSHGPRQSSIISTIHPRRIWYMDQCRRSGTLCSPQRIAFRRMCFLPMPGTWGHSHHIPSAICWHPTRSEQEEGCWVRGRSVTTPSRSCPSASLESRHIQRKARLDAFAIGLEGPQDDSRSLSLLFHGPGVSQTTGRRSQSEPLERRERRHAEPCGHRWLSEIERCSPNPKTQRYRPWRVQGLPRYDRGVHGYKRMARLCGGCPWSGERWCGAWARCPNYARHLRFCEDHERWAWNMEYTGPGWTPERVKQKKARLGKRREQYPQRYNRAVTKAQELLRQSGLVPKDSIPLDVGQGRLLLFGLRVSITKCVELSKGHIHPRRQRSWRVRKVPETSPIARRQERK